jgi:outer membrane biosynthesis protein TonB
VIAVAALLLWILAFRLLDYMLHTETVHKLKILIMSFICGIVFALYFPLLLEWINPNLTNGTGAEVAQENHISVPIWHAKTALPSATTTAPSATTPVPATPLVTTSPPSVPSSPTPATPPVTTPPVVEKKPASIPPKPEVEKEPEPKTAAPKDESKPEETAPKPVVGKENP